MRTPYLSLPVSHRQSGQVAVDPVLEREPDSRNDVSGYQELVFANQIDNFQLDNPTNFANGRSIDEPGINAVEFRPHKNRGMST